MSFSSYFFSVVSLTLSSVVLALVAEGLLTGAGVLAGLEIGSSLVRALFGIYNGPRAPQAPSRLAEMEAKIRE